MIHEECGLFGVYAGANKEAREGIAHLCYAGLFALQHRGQESAGIAVNAGGAISCRRDAGLAGEVFSPEALGALGTQGGGDFAIAHVRYATTGSGRRANAQPFAVKHIKGSLALAHNGNLTNAAELRQTRELAGTIFHSSSDTEVIMYTIIHERLEAASIEEAVERSMYRLKGAYSLVMMSRRKLIAARDPNGFRPLCMGRLDGAVVFASESCALAACGAQFERDIAPGEIVVVDEDGVRSVSTHCGGASSLCVFEYIYFARPDSVIDGVDVHAARLRAGEILARERAVDADVVIGVPDSGLDAAIGFSRESGIPCDFGFIKNKYIGRTFIVSGQKRREDAVRIKLNPIVSVVQGKRVVIIDDSIVRGTTSMRIIKMLRGAGAREVHLRLSCPPFLYPCYFGADIGARESLIAAERPLFEIRDMIGADTLEYLPLDALSQITAGCACGLCDACFSGRYPVDISSVQLKSQFEEDISSD